MADFFVILASIFALTIATQDYFVRKSPRAPYILFLVAGAILSFRCAVLHIDSWYYFIALTLLFPLPSYLIITLIVLVWKNLRLAIIQMASLKKKNRQSAGLTNKDFLFTVTTFPYQINHLYRSLEQLQNDYLNLQHPQINLNPQHQLSTYNQSLDKLQAIKISVKRIQGQYHQCKDEFYALIKGSPDDAQHDHATIALENASFILQNLEQSVTDHTSKIQGQKALLEKQELKRAYQEILTKYNNKATSIWATYKGDTETAFWDDYEQMVFQMKQLRDITIQMAG